MVLPGSPAIHGQSAVAEQVTDERSLRSTGDLGASSHQKVLTGLTCDSPSASELICYFAGRVDKHDATAHDSYLVAAQMLIHREWNLSRDTLKSSAHPPHKLQPSAVTSGKVWKREREREAEAKQRSRSVCTLWFDPWATNCVTGLRRCRIQSDRNSSSMQEAGLRNWWRRPAASHVLHLCSWGDCFGSAPQKPFSVCI